MKQAGSSATEANNPVNVCFGKVTSASPLKILVEQKITLGSAQLILTRNVMDHDVMVTVDWGTNTSLSDHKHIVDTTSDEGGTDSHTHLVSGNTDTVDLSHKHTMNGKKKMTIHNALQKGDEVILLRMQGGQKYVVMDRVV